MWCRRRPEIASLLVLLMAALMGAALISPFPATQTIDPALKELALVQWNEAHELGKQGEWQEAAQLMQRVIPDLSHDLRKWQELHNVKLYLGEFDEVDAICDEMLRRFGDTSDPNAAHILAQVCLALPNREIDPQVQRLAELSATFRNPTHYRDLGMLYYRQGNLAEAEQWLNKALKSSYLYRPATLYYLAMVRLKRGNEAGAREALRKAEQYLELRTSQLPTGSLDRLQFSSLFIEAVRREAEMSLPSK
jgi:tetratricopeptide (TPR) repeat protein